MDPLRYHADCIASGSPAASRSATAAPAGKVTVDRFAALHYGRREDHPQRVLKIFHHVCTPPSVTRSLRPTTLVLRETYDADASCRLSWRRFSQRAVSRMAASVIASVTTEGASDE
jgi:hypothetical protein